MTKQTFGERTTQAGFTILEISVVIVLVVILSGIALAYIPNAQMRSRDSERLADVAALKNYFEQQYVENASSSYPTYVPTTSLASTLTTISNSGLHDSIYAPGSSSASVNEASSNNDQTSVVSTSNYIYQPFLSDGSLCTSSSANQPCVRFKLWYKLEENSPNGTFIESLHQQ